MDDYADYLEDQCWDLVAFIEKHGGKLFDMEEWNKVIRLSDELAEWWEKIYELRKHVPSPIGFVDTLAAIFPLVILPGTKPGILYYKRFYREAQATEDVHKLAVVCFCNLGRRGVHKTGTPAPAGICI